MAPVECKGGEVQRYEDRKEWVSDRERVCQRLNERKVYLPITEK